MTIVRDDESLDLHAAPRKANLMGAYWPDTAEIAIRSDLALHTELEVSLHEVGHVIWEKTGLPASWEERVIDAITPHYLALIRDNPYYIEFLQQKG